MKKIEICKGNECIKKKISQIQLDPEHNIFYNTPKGDGIFYNH